MPINLPSHACVVGKIIIKAPINNYQGIALPVDELYFYLSILDTHMVDITGISSLFLFRIVW